MYSRRWRASEYLPASTSVRARLYWSSIYKPDSKVAVALNWFKPSVHPVAALAAVTKNKPSSTTREVITRGERSKPRRQPGFWSAGGLDGLVGGGPLLEGAG